MASLPYISITFSPFCGPITITVSLLRYYLKNNQVTEPLVPDELAADLPREGSVHFLQLNALEVAVQVTGTETGLPLGLYR